MAKTEKSPKLKQPMAPVLVGSNIQIKWIGRLGATGMILERIYQVDLIHQLANCEYTYI